MSLSLPGALAISFVGFLLLAAMVASGVITGEFAFAAFVVVVAVVSWWSAPLTAAVVSVVAFAFVNGFALDGDGTLAWHGQSDLIRVFCLVGLAVTVALVGRHTHRRPNVTSTTTSRNQRDHA